jgi:excisionase family DNA binding protein
MSDPPTAGSDTDEESSVTGARNDEVGQLVGDRLLTVAEVADAMRVSNMTVYRMIRAAELRALRVGKSYRIRASEFDRYLDERQVDGG